MWHNAIISRREATIQMVDKQFGDERQHYEDYKTLFLDIEETGQDLVDFASEDANNKKARDILLRQLNRYELIALAVSKGVFSERFYKRWFYTQLTRDFDRLLPLIKAMRQHFTNEAIFCEFESLAQRWERKKHPVKHPPTWKILWWIATGRRSKASLALRSPKRPPAANNLPKPGSGG
jgi:hypothetical protein